MHLRTAAFCALTFCATACAAVLSIDDVGFDDPTALDGGSDGEGGGGGNDASDARFEDALADAQADGATDHGDAAPQPDAAPATGCSDGTREGFKNASQFSSIAGCAGGWSELGLLEDAGPSCNRDAGDTSSNPSGTRCHADDLCAAGWHVCHDALDVSRSGGQCATFGAAQPDAGLFFATKQPGSGGTNCGDSGVDDLFGCGTMGLPAVPTCNGLNATSGDGCRYLALPWVCGTGSNNERAIATKPGAAGGGVLCCQD